ncbi:hypothetical protein F5Y18DRAFT_405978 [Xylariaceae sp. FL1019]|nr:hypothetical protein F5Y18DRAFT_405978 [Xylariaceae sp. FL1019]
MPSLHSRSGAPSLEGLTRSSPRRGSTATERTLTEDGSGCSESLVNLKSDTEQFDDCQTLSDVPLVQKTKVSNAVGKIKSRLGVKDDRSPKPKKHIPTNYCPTMRDTFQALAESRQ